MLGSARLVRRRATGHVGVLLTATLTALVTAVLLVSATVLAPGVGESALDRTIAGAGPDDTELTASTGLDDGWPELDERVRAAATGSGVIESVTATISSTAYTAPGLGDDERLALGYVEDAAARATLSAGRWPRDGADVVETALHLAAMDALGLAPGDMLRVRPLTGGGAPVEVTVVGAYVPADADDPVWRGYGDGVRPAEGGGFTVIGPILAERGDFLDRLAPGTASAAWLLPLAGQDVTLGNAGEVVTELRSLRGDLSDLRATDTGQQMAVGGGVADLVDRARDAASSTRALLLVVVAMLAVLGGWALLFTARLVAVRRAPTSALMRARGAREGRMLRWSVLGVAVPAALVAVAAPPLSRLVLEPLRDRVDGTPTGPAGWLVAGCVGAIWLVLMVAADLRAGRSVTGVAAESARPPRRAAAQRAGLDLVLLALGALGLQQLRRPPEDASEIVLVIAPALVVLAGTVVLIRALPWVARGVATLTAPHTGVAAMLGAQETARRTARHVAAGVLVVLAITVSVFSATTQSTWDAFRTDTVDLAEPADVRLDVDAGAMSGTPDELEAALLELPGVEQAMSVLRIGLNDGDVSVDVVGVDAERAATVMRWDDHARLDALRAGGGSLPVLVTTGYADWLGLSAGDDVTVDLGGPEPVQVRVAGVVDAVPGSTQRTAVLADRDALNLRLEREVPDEWWLATTDDGAAAAAAASVVAGIDDVSTHAETLRDAEDDPSSAGILTGLTAGLAFAAVFVLIGVVVHTVTSFQSRSGEYALLRAIGLGRRSVAGSVTIEHGVLLGFSTVAGLGLGLVVAWLVVPHAVGGLTGLPEVPPLHLSIPWPTVALMAGSIAVLAAVLVTVQVALTRRLDVPAVLREGT